MQERESRPTKRADRQTPPLGYIDGLLDAVPMLSHLVEIRRKERVDLTTGVSIEVHTASYEKLPGYTVLAAICDEVAFWKSESSALLRTVISSPTPYTSRRRPSS